VAHRRARLETILETALSALRRAYEDVDAGSSLSLEARGPKFEW
jgi:hypothetical protein